MKISVGRVRPLSSMTSIKYNIAQEHKRLLGANVIILRYKDTDTIIGDV